ncbi:MAG: cytochrome C biogenesis protein, partial [Prochloron sp. SP5CPC1]|nr:cytochrome C biogenesis protein [Candidatus Paraprochloron terpiosi SP5CPC1]
MKLLKFLIGFCLGLLILILPLSQWQVSDLEPLQTLAVQLDGRKKPLDTVAREQVTQIHGFTHYRQDNGEVEDYFPTYLSLWFNQRDWNQEPFILFSYRPLKEQVGLDPERKYFSFQELISSDLPNIFNRVKEKETQGFDLTRDEREALTVADRMTLMVNIVGNDNLPLIPHPSDIKGKWVGFEAGETYYQPAQMVPIRETYQSMKVIYGEETENLGAMGSNLGTALQELSPEVYPAPELLQREVNFSALHPFGKAWKLYILAFLAMVFGLWFQQLDFYWGSIGIFVAGLGIQSYGFIARMTIAGRPPVTNMYESVVWVAFGVAAVALLFELIYRAKYYLLAAAPLAAASLVLADSLPA